MFTAGSCLVANDLVRVIFPSVQQVIIAQICGENEQDDNNNATNAFSFFEEEVKHSGKDRFYTLPLIESELEASVAHLIRDDDVRHLAYIPIFSPPPNLTWRGVRIFSGVIMPSNASGVLSLQDTICLFRNREASL